MRWLAICRAAACSLLACLALAACGPSAARYPYVRTERCAPNCDGGMDGGADAGPVDAGPPDVPNTPLEDWDAGDGGEAGPLTGLFALQVTIVAKVAIEVQTHLYYRVRMLERGADLRLRLTPCRVDLPKVPGLVELSIPPPLEAVLQTKNTDEEGTYLSSDTPVGATFMPPTTTLVLGAMLADPTNDPLPTMSDPTGAFDEDGDGHPGVTVDATTVLCRHPEKAYVALRATADVSGTVADADTITGGVTSHLDLEILGYTDPCLAAATNLPITVAPGSGFVVKRVGDAQDLNGDGNVTCPEIAWFADSIFPPPPADAGTSP